MTHYTYCQWWGWWHEEQTHNHALSFASQGSFECVALYSHYSHTFLYFISCSRPFSLISPCEIMLLVCMTQLIMMHSSVCKTRAHCSSSHVNARKQASKQSKKIPTKIKLSAACKSRGGITFSIFSSAAIANRSKSGQTSEIVFPSTHHAHRRRQDDATRRTSAIDKCAWEVD